MQLTVVEKKTVDEWLNAVDYSDDPDYTPSQFALEFVSFIKLVDGGSTENKTPVVHYKMLDNFVANHGLDIINLCHRGMAKSTLKEYLILYLAVFNVLPGLGEVPYALYVSDSMDNGVKKMRKQLEMRWENSEFLRELIPEIRFTDIRWEFTNASGKKLVVTGHGAKTGVRGPLSLDSLVYLDNGAKTIKDVEVGDMIYTPSGNLTKVTGKSEVFNDPMFALSKHKEIR